MECTTRLRTEIRFIAQDDWVNSNIFIGADWFKKEQRGHNDIGSELIEKTTTREEESFPRLGLQVNGFA